MEIREQFINSALATCRHFNGSQNKKCSAGIQYLEWKQGVEERAMPCIPKHINNHETWPCDLFEIMSQADAEKEADERIVRMNRGIKGRHAAKDDAKAKGLGKGHGGNGAIPCPSCEGGTLHYSVAGYNGHMHGRCTTTGCVSWME
jgi:hypothetical protein